MENAAPRMFIVSENSKSLMSPRTTTFAFASTARIESTGSFTICLLVALGLGRADGRLEPSNSGLSPPFELKWFVIRKNLSPRNVNSPASGFRLAPRPVRAGSTLARGELGAAGAGYDRRRRRVAARTVDEGKTAIGAEDEADADVSARLAAVLVVDRVDLPVRVRRPPAAAIAATSRSSVMFASTTGCRSVAVDAPLLSWISSSETTSGARMLSTICAASASYFAWPSLPPRFSTLKVAIESSFARARRSSHGRARRRRA